MPEIGQTGSIDGLAQQFDVVIVGDGLVGRSLACALGQADIRVALLGRRAEQFPGREPADLRPIALAYGSARILDTLGVWSQLGATPSPITRVHVSERGVFGVTRLDAEDLRVPALGYVAAAGILLAALSKKLSGLASVNILASVGIETIEPCPDGLQLTCTGPAPEPKRKLQTQLLVVAEGGQSQILETLGVRRRHHDYRQMALTATVVPELDHRQTAFERFTRRGPLALLPLPQGRCGLVWTLPTDQMDAVEALDDETFLATLGRQFGKRLGRFLASDQRVVHRVMRMTTDRIVTAHCAIVGNAANQLHPVAGQGFNLGLRDVAALAELVIDSRDAGVCLGGASLLECYAHRRRADHAKVVRFTDGVIRLFTNACTPVVVLRNLGMVALDTNRFVKRSFARHAMGLAGRRSRLAIAPTAVGLHE